LRWLFLLRGVFARPSGSVPAAAFLLAVSVFAQPPLIFNRGIFNAASFVPAGIPGGAIARGSIFSLFGARLGPTPPANANSFPLGTTLSGVAINVVQGSTTVSAIPLYVSASQINAIMPSNAPLGTASIQVVVNGSGGNLHPVRIASSDFGIFTARGIGIGPGILQNFIAADNQPINSPTITAQLGQAITLWGTGLGPVTGGDNVAPKAGNLPVQTEVFVGGVSAPLLYSGRTPCCAGVDQIVFTVPSAAPSGCWVPVYVRTAGSTVSNFVTMAIQPSGGVCSTDVQPQLGSILVRGGSFGEAIVTRATTRQDVGTSAPVDVTADYHAHFAFSPKPGPFPFNPATGLPVARNVARCAATRLGRFPDAEWPSRIPCSELRAWGPVRRKCRLSRGRHLEQYPFQLSLPGSRIIYFGGNGRRRCRAVLDQLHNFPACGLD